MQTAMQRRAMRRAVRTSCQVVGQSEFKLLGEQVIDLSPRGMLVACSRPARVGDDVLVSFRAPGHEELWFDAEAVIARVIAGQRANDNNLYGAGLEFTYFEKSARHELLSRLAGFPPPVPKRRLQSVSERGSAVRGAPSVLVRPVVMVYGEPVIPLIRRKNRAPLGTFSFAR